MRELRTLFIEDSEDDAELETLELERSGFRVTARRVDTLPALQSALQQPWDIILCDFSMPTLTGLEALKVVREAGIDTPFIIVSGSVGEDVAVEAMRSGAHDYMLKGNLARLGAAVDRELREAAVRRERRDAVAALEQSYREQSRLVSDLEEALRFRDEFLTVASHELKTPLTALVLQTERLRRRVGQLGDGHHPDVREMAQMLPAINRQAQRLTELINSVLDVTQLQIGQLQLQYEELDLVPVVREAVSPFEALQQNQGTVLNFSAPAQVFGRWDRARVEQVVSNLVSNAVKYGQGRPVDVTLESANRGAILRVTDRGIGIAAEDQARIFLRYERAAPARAFWGLGLGLWAARQIVEALGGTIQLDSQPELGSTFTVWLPSSGIPAN